MTLNLEDNSSLARRRSQPSVPHGANLSFNLAVLDDCLNTLTLLVGHLACKNSCPGSSQNFSFFVSSFTCVTAEKLSGYTKAESSR